MKISSISLSASFSSSGFSASLKLLASSVKSFKNISKIWISKVVSLNKLISEKVIKKISTNDINEKELSKISHNRTFNFVYAANDEYINVLKNLKNYPPAPLDDFINHVTDFISNLPEEKIDEIQKKIKENIIN